MRNNCGIIARGCNTSARQRAQSRDMGERGLEEATAADMERRRRRPSTEDATLVRAAPAHQLLHRAATTFGNTQGVTAWPNILGLWQRPGSAPGPQQGSHLVAQTALGSSALPGRGQPTGRPATASDNRPSLSLRPPVYRRVTYTLSTILSLQVPPRTILYLSTNSLSLQVPPRTILSRLTTPFRYRRGLHSLSADGAHRLLRLTHMARGPTRQVPGAHSTY